MPHRPCPVPQVVPGPGEQSGSGAGQPLSSRVTRDGVEYITVGSTLQTFTDEQIGTIESSEDLRVLRNTLPANFDPFELFDFYRYGNEDHDGYLDYLYSDSLPGHSLGGMGSGGRFGSGSGSGSASAIPYAYSETVSIYESEGTESRLVDQSQGVTFSSTGAIAVLATSEQSASSVLNFSQDLTVRNGRGVVDAAGQANESTTHEEGTTTAFTAYETSSDLATDGSRVDTTTYQDDAHTVSTHSTTVDFGQWQLDDESFSHQHSEGSLDDARNLFDSRETATAAATGEETVTVEKLRHYRTDDDSSYTGLDAQLAGNLFVPLGQTVPTGAWRTNTADAWGLAVRTDTDGEDQRLDEATTHVITVSAAETTTTTLDIDTRTRSTSTRAHSVMQFDFQLGFGDPATSGSSATSESGGMQYTQTRDHLHEHTNDSTYNHGIRTNYAYTDDTNQNIASFTSFGLSSADFDMDYFGTHVIYQQRHVEGDGTHETVSGNQGGVWSHATHFTVDLPNGGLVSFSSEQSSFEDITYAVGHLPTRNYWGARVTSGQDYNVWHRTSGTDSTSSHDFNGGSTTAAHVRTEDWLLPDGSFTSNVQQWGHNDGNPYDSETDSPLTLNEDQPLWLADSFPIQSPTLGTNFAFQQLNSLAWQAGYNAAPVANQWNAGTNGSGLSQSQLLMNASSVTPSWTGWLENQTINKVHYPKVWGEYRELPDGHYVFTYFTAPPSEGGQVIAHDTDIHETQGLARALESQTNAYAATHPAAPPNEQDEEEPVSAESVTGSGLGDDGGSASSSMEPQFDYATIKPKTPPQRAAETRQDLDDARERYRAAVERLRKARKGTDATEAEAAKQARLSAKQEVQSAEARHLAALDDLEAARNAERARQLQWERLADKGTITRQVQDERNRLFDRLETENFANPFEEAELRVQLKKLDALLPTMRAKLSAEANRIEQRTLIQQLQSGETSLGLLAQSRGIAIAKDGTWIDPATGQPLQLAGVGDGVALMLLATQFGGYRENFWNTLDKSLEKLLRSDVGGFQVHHLFQDKAAALKKVFDPLFDVNAANNLVAVPDYIHHKITTQQNEWWRDCIADLKSRDKLPGSFKTTEIEKVVAELQARGETAELTRMLGEFEEFTDDLDRQYRPFFLKRNASISDVNELAKNLGQAPPKTWTAKSLRDAIYSPATKTVFEGGEVVRQRAITTALLRRAGLDASKGGKSLLDKLRDIGKGVTAGKVFTVGMQCLAVITFLSSVGEAATSVNSPELEDLLTKARRVAETEARLGHVKSGETLDLLDAMKKYLERASFKDNPVFFEIWQALYANAVNKPD